MEGVEILNIIHTYSRLVHPDWVIALGIAIIIISIIGICTVNHPTIQNILLTMVTIAIVGFGICLVCASIKTNKIVDTKYQVIVSDDVNFNEFQEKYEIIEQNGKIYTVREK